MTQTECDRLRAACVNSPRDKAIIELLIQTGIKLSELTRLTLNDVDLDGSGETGERQIGFIRILGNRGKNGRMIPLNEKSKLALENYLKFRENPENQILFLNRFGKPVSDRAVQKTLKKYFQRAEINQDSVHTLRHTFGIHHASKGMSAVTLQEAMGHEDMRSIMIYASLAGQKRDRIRNNAL